MSLSLISLLCIQIKLAWIVTSLSRIVLIRHWENDPSTSLRLYLLLEVHVDRWFTRIVIETVLMLALHVYTLFNYAASLRFTGGLTIDCGLFHRLLSKRCLA